MKYIIVKRLILYNIFSANEGGGFVFLAPAARGPAGTFINLCNFAGHL